MVLGTPFGHALDQSYASPEDMPFREGASDARIPQGTDLVPTPRVEALHYMTLTSPITGQSVTFEPGEALPAWAQPYR